MADQNAPEPTAPDPVPPAGGSFTAHPTTSLLIGLLVLASIGCALVVPIYARVTPYVGDFPFFYFYLLAYMPVVALVLWVVTLLQRHLDSGRLNSGRLDNGRLDNSTGGQR
ncbi:MAG TPA: DUF3311 domain-containing protein [Trebonia sp.]|jgi:hypothetical protein|nr:DUF3311 domain-containing protein [Trebonia sp.]